MPQPDTRPVGIFVHHQGRGHAERCAHLANAVVEWRPVTMFCTRDDIFPPLNPGIEIRTIPSLFEAQGSEAPRLAGMRCFLSRDNLHAFGASLGASPRRLKSWYDRGQRDAERFLEGFPEPPEC